MTTITSDEVRLRAELDAAVRALRSSLERCPLLDHLDADSRAVAGVALDDAHLAWEQATSITTMLEQLSGVTEEALLLATASRITLAVTREALTLLIAELDTQAPAA